MYHANQFYPDILIVKRNLFLIKSFSFRLYFGKINFMKAKDIVKFSKPSDEEKDALMVVLEMRGERVLVSDLRFAKWAIPPTDVYAVSDLEVTNEATVTV